MNQSGTVDVLTVLKEEIRSNYQKFIQKKERKREYVVVSVSELIDKASDPESGWVASTTEMFLSSHS